MIATVVISMIGRGIYETRSDVPRSSEALNFTRWFSSNFHRAVLKSFFLPPNLK